MLLGQVDDGGFYLATADSAPRNLDLDEHQPASDRPWWARMELGRLLMEAAYAHMRQAGATTVALEMVADNDVARRFYERGGFTTTFVQMHRRLGPDD